MPSTLDGTYLAVTYNALGVETSRYTAPMTGYIYPESFNYSLTSSLDIAGISAAVLVPPSHTSSGSITNDCLGYRGSFSADSRSGPFGSLEEVTIEITMIDPTPCCDGVCATEGSWPPPSSIFYR